MADEMLDVAAGFALRPADGWEAGRDVGRMLLSPPGKEALVVAIPHAASDPEELAPILEQGWTEPGLELMPTGPPEEREGSVAVDLSGTADGQDAVGSLVAMFSPHDGGVLLIGVAPAGAADLRSLVDTVAATVRFVEPDPSELIGTWRERLAGRKLTYLSQYSSTGGGGIQERHEILLHPEGRFDQDGEFVASVGDAGSAIQQVEPPAGEWRVEAVAGQAMLRLEGDGTVTEYRLSEGEGEVFLNGRRFFVT